MAIQRYNYDIQVKQSAQIPDADALSRLPDPTELKKNNPDPLAEYQIFSLTINSNS